MADKKTPDVIVGALMVNPRGEVLLWRSAKWLGAMVMPGGRVERGESVAQALERELYEETGLPIFDIQFLGYQESIDASDYYKPRHMLLLDFACKVNATELPNLKKDREFVWAAPERALELELGRCTRVALENYLRLSPGQSLPSSKTMGAVTA